MIIKNYIQFINEEISGAEIPTGPGGSFGAAFGETRLQNKTINKSHTTVVHAQDQENPYSKNELTDDLFFEDNYNSIYVDFLKAGGSQLDLTGEKESDLAIMLNFLKEN